MSPLDPPVAKSTLDPLASAYGGAETAGVTPIDIGRSLDEGDWSPFQKLVLAMAALAFTVDGLANQVLGLSIPALIKALHASRSAFAPVAALGLIGVTFGTAAGGILGDRFGRRWALIVSVLLFGVMTAATAWVNDIGYLSLLRTLAGLGLGGAVPNATALIAEYTPIRRRSMAIAVGMVFIPIGGLIAAALATWVLPQFTWRGLFLIGGMTPILLSIVLIGALPESPRFLMRHQARRGELLRLLGRLGYGFANDVQLVDGSLTLARTPINALFGPERRRDTLALWSGFFFWLLASYTFFSWGPAMLASRGFGMAVTSLGLTLFNVGGICGSFVGGYTIERFGSRVSILGLAVGGTVAAAVLSALPFNAVHGLTALLIGLAFEGLFVAGVQNGLYAIAAHLYPPFVRATGVGSASGVGRIGAVASAFTGVITLNLGGATGYFVFIAVVMALTVVSLLFMRGHIPKVGAAAASRRQG